MRITVFFILQALFLHMNAQDFSPELTKYCTALSKEFEQIPKDRVLSLEEIGEYIIQELEQDNPASLLFICTHNSRRSQLGQIWALTGASFYGISNIRFFSGGTGATAFNPRAVSALERAGFKATSEIPDQANPRYEFHSGAFRSDAMFSKKFSDPPNPSEKFCALMVCSQADEACPVVPGASDRISLPYEDPKEFDGTPQESSAYDERCRQIGREMFYVVNYVSSRIF